MSSRVLVAMSGGVDSSVTALLLKEQGFSVAGVHMKLWDYAEVGGDPHRDGRCCSIDAINDCRLVCDSIGAPFYVMDFSAQFRREVIEDFVSEYRAGRTPNPCVRCNSRVRWRAFLDKAQHLDCDYIATGHYARIVRGDDGRCRLLRGVDDSRDQSYVLWGLTQGALAQTLMPLGDMCKTEVRRIAREHGLRTAARPESREICFIADDDYGRFLRDWAARMGEPIGQPGEIVHQDGTVLGQHRGTAFYTVGQRKGLGIAYSTPLYVLAIDALANRVVVGSDEALFKGEMTVTQVNWIDGRPPATMFDAQVKIRYKHPAAPAQVRILGDDSAQVIFHDRQRAITSGQSAVFYDGDLTLGGGVIT